MAARFEWSTRRYGLRALGEHRGSCALDTLASMNENVHDCDTWREFGDGLALRIAL